MEQGRSIDEGTLSLRLESGAGERRITVLGELDVTNSAALERALREALAGDGTRVVLDLSALGFIDSTGLRTLLLAERISATDSNRLVVRRPGGQVARMLALTGIGDELTFVD